MRRGRAGLRIRAAALALLLAPATAAAQPACHRATGAADG